ncbi:hypothetical protein B0T14DRAFT_602861 [Immersiella caudata]|uniref:F-box domain-containing protein n=1 Tax=Immersiella caudata TaxID=314043 RepID=A0AA39WNZ4_9PEZI|nr:hypothetical protein B0T14DRAFT_602861 [Immersiella caudata]
MYSQSGAPRLNAADLPEDILRCIFDYFVGHPNHPVGPRCDDDFRTLQTLRSVCRSFCNVASPLLIPTLRASISPESLRRIEHVTKSPLIAAGIRTIQISTAYRPKELAEDVKAYTDLQRKALRSLERACDWYTEFMDEIPKDERNGDEDEILKAMHIYFEMDWAWRAWAQNEDGDPPSDNRDRHIALLSESFDEYRRLQREQERLLMDGTFVATLAACISRLPSLRRVCFLDQADVNPDDFSQRDNLTVLANDHAKFRQLLVAPHTWAALEDLDHPPDIPAVKLLWQLPMAMHANGTPVPAISISRMPILSNFNYLCATSNDSDGWSALTAAFSTVESIHLSAGNHVVIRKEHMSPEAQSHFAGYLSALLSSPLLQSIHIDLYSLQINTGNPIAHRDGLNTQMFNPIGPAFAKLRSPDLRELILNGASLTQDELERCFRGVGTKLQRIHVSAAGVSGGGGWAHALDILRGKVTDSSSSSKKCSVYFSRLCGGGFEKLKAPPRQRGTEQEERLAYALSWGEPQGPAEKQEERDLWAAAGRYVAGEEEVNPLVGLEVGGKREV